MPRASKIQVVKKIGQNLRSFELSLWRRLFDATNAAFQPAWQISPRQFQIGFPCERCSANTLSLCILTGVVSSRFKNDCLNCMCDYALTPILGLHFYHILILVHCIVDNCPLTYHDSFFSRQSDTPEDNADPVGDTTTKGLLLWWFDAVFKIVIR